jgi:hypothetical protein
MLFTNIQRMSVINIGALPSLPLKFARSIMLKSVQIAGHEHRKLWLWNVSNDRSVVRMTRGIMNAGARSGVGSGMGYAVKSQNLGRTAAVVFKEGSQYLQHRRDTFLASINETPFAAVESDHMECQFMYVDCK